MQPGLEVNEACSIGTRDPLEGRVVDTDLRRLLTERLRCVQARIHCACARAGRTPGDVRLVGITKTASVDAARALFELGVVELGESRPQALWRKAGALPAGIRWHLVGHLQRNKIERTLPLTRLIHSVDSERLLQALEAAAAPEQSIEVLLEVNMSREANKHGFEPGAVPGVMASLSDLRRVRVRGLMTMAALDEEAERARPAFAGLRRLRDEMRSIVPPPHSVTDLSMGMTHDFEVAVEEGATLVRVGSALFEGLTDPDP